MIPRDKEVGTSPMCSNTGGNRRTAATGIREDDAEKQAVKKVQGGAKVGLQLRNSLFMSLFINYCIIFETNNCKPTFSPTCIKNSIFIKFKNQSTLHILLMERST